MVFDLLRGCDVLQHCSGGVKEVEINTSCHLLCVQRE